MKKRDWIIAKETPEKLKMDDLISAAASVTGVYKKLIMGETRHRSVTDARHRAVAACYWHTDASSVAVGRKFKRDHATVLNSCRRVLSDPRAMADVEMIRLRALGVLGD
jgi:chromosomal replication initiation ATPase DnaA